MTDVSPAADASTPKATGRPRLAVVILTLNESLNLPAALASVSGWADEVIVLDSGSTDDTTAIAERAGARVVTHRFENYGRQRNVGLSLAAEADWVLFLDADEQATPALRAEIDEVLSRHSSINGYYIRRRLIWMGRWIRHGGYYPVWILRLGRSGATRCEERSINENLIVQGRTGRLQNDLLHDDRKGIGDWIIKHHRYATREAAEIFTAREEGAELTPRLFGDQRQRIRWLRLKVWNRMPPVVRPFLYFVYRYVVRGGFLDGGPGLVFHFMQGLWYPLLIDLKYLELRAQRSATPPRL